MGLEDHANECPAVLSWGQRQRVALAQVRTKTCTFCMITVNSGLNCKQTLLYAIALLPRCN
ncbi:hypothetical protein [Fischerella muscicola]|uniref:hypothetical protein n=1 Tax=Fischerella muscicola TaxID=92938 RepID=UPI0015E1294A|nr:hypothetical protein [Fischerella muscicola]